MAGIRVGSAQITYERPHLIIVVCPLNNCANEYQKEYPH